MPEARLPHPYLTHDEVRGLCQAIGFDWPADIPAPVETEMSRDMFNALTKLIAGAIAGWVGLELLEEDQTWASLDQELLEYAGGFLLDS